MILIVGAALGTCAAILVAAGIARAVHPHDATATATTTSTSTTAVTAAVPGVETWGCGFAAPTARMQYTGSSFAELLLQRFSWAMVFRRADPALEGAFPRPGQRFATEVPDTVLDLALLPAARGWAWLATRARLLYLRRIQFQMLLVLLTLVAILAWGFAW